MRNGVWRTDCGGHIVGKHWGNSPSEQSARARTVAVRCVSGGLCLSLAVLAFGGFQGLSANAPYEVPAAMPPAGAVGPETLDALAHSAATVAPDSPVTVTADALALLAFNRTTVDTVTKEGVRGELNVAAEALSRPAAGFLMAPLESLRPSSPFGLRRSPLTGVAGEFHWGQDFAAPCGTRVYSADAGVVRAVGWHPWGGGNRVEIDHGNGLITTYNHLEAIAVKKGDSVRVGEVIARVGTTGSSTGCHLHFETILNGSHTNPRDWTLLPIKQVDQLGPIEMTSYGPDAGNESPTRIGWAIPVREDLTHVVAGGDEEQPVAVAAKPSASASAAATEAASGKSSAKPSPTPQLPLLRRPPTPTGTATETPTPDGTASAKPTPTGTATPTPTPSASSAKPTPTGTATPTPTPSASTATPTPTGTATETPTPDRTASAKPTPTETCDADADPHTGPDNNFRKTVGSNIGTAIRNPAALLASVRLSKRDGGRQREADRSEAGPCHPAARSTDEQTACAAVGHQVRHTVGNQVGYQVGDAVGH